jgi:hypothetical protein
MDRRMRDVKKRLLALAEPFGARLEIEHSGRSHLRATFTGAAHVDVYLANSPSDFRAEKNESAYVRRKLRSIGRTA